MITTKSSFKVSKHNIHTEVFLIRWYLFKLASRLTIYLSEWIKINIYLFLHTGILGLLTSKYVYIV
jgi:hypothetical protein